ncbi:MAG: hypothetical protein GY835_23740 [bacterium]|nr:hypothetical protein [bacterium]
MGGPVMGKQLAFINDRGAVLARVRRRAQAEPPIARATDGGGSHAAADRLTRSGRRWTQCGLVMGAVHRWPGKTSRELAELMGADRHMVAKRLADLRAVGRVANPASNIREYIWVATEEISPELAEVFERAGGANVRR